MATIDIFPPAYHEALAAEAERVRRDQLAPRGLETRRVLIVGGGGYVGTVLGQALLEAGFAVRCLDNLLWEQETALYHLVANPRFEFVKADLCDRAAFTAALEGVTDVVLLAGLVGDPVTKKYPEAAARVNDDGHAMMLEALEGRGLGACARGVLLGALAAGCS